jgi:transcriptional regulator with XRE-family HTH domain
VGFPLDKQLSNFLRRQRGEMTYAQFSRKVGLPPSTLFRLENCQQSLSLKRLDWIMGKLKVRMRDIFPES